MRRLFEDAKNHKNIIKNDFYCGKCLMKTGDGYYNYLYVHCRYKKCQARLIY